MALNVHKNHKAYYERAFNSCLSCFVARKGLTQKIRTLCFVIINSVVFSLLRVCN